MVSIMLLCGVQCLQNRVGNGIGCVDSALVSNQFTHPLRDYSVLGSLGLMTGFIMSCEAF